MNKGADVFVGWSIRARYTSLALSHLDASAQDVVYLYDAYVRDKTTGSAEANSFEDALVQHRLIDQITQVQ